MANSNLRKAAILLHGLPESVADRLRDKLAPEHEEAVAAELESMGAVDPSEQEAVMREFAGASAGRDDSLGRAQDAPFRFLYEVDADTLLGLLVDEHAQTIALVLSYLPPPQAAAVLAALASDQQLSVICRLATMQETSPEIVRDVEEGLRRRLFGAMESPRGARRGQRSRDVPCHGAGGRAQAARQTGRGRAGIGP